MFRSEVLMPSLPALAAAILNLSASSEKGRDHRARTLILMIKDSAAVLLIRDVSQPSSGIQIVLNATWNVDRDTKIRFRNNRSRPKEHQNVAIAI